MNGGTESPGLVSRGRRLFLLVWLIGCGLLLLANANRIRLGLSPDPDDALRLLQVRDWLAGQSWFDVNQYRLNGPDGVPMHWSRLVDLPIAAVILFLKPLIGQDSAELAARVAVPLLTLGVAMALVGELARRLTTARVALLAIIAVPLSLGTFTQMRPMRIDHHGWQIVLGLVIVLALLDRNPRRAGVIAGSAAAAWLSISVEAMPLVAATGAWLAIRWLQDPSSSERLRLFTATLALVSVVLFAAMHAPSSWAEQACDAVSAAHLLAVSAAAAWVLIAVRPDIASMWLRFAILGGAGALAGSAMFFGNSQCLTDPFASLDPLVRAAWYERVHEGLPIWKQEATTPFFFLAQPIVGIIGALMALRLAPAEQRTDWQAYLFMLVASTVASMLVLRVGAVANILSLVGTAYLVALAFGRARALRSMPIRMVATILALFLVIPAYVVAGAVLPTNSLKVDTPAEKARFRICFSQAEIRALGQLPASEVAAPLDISPAIILDSPHRAIASGHHRNVSGMRDVILLFTLAPDEAAAILSRRNIDYLVVCPGMREVKSYAKYNPAGLAARMATGRAPDWLEPVQLPGIRALQVWRVRKDSAAFAAAAGRSDAAAEPRAEKLIIARASSVWNEVD